MIWSLISQIPLQNKRGQFIHVQDCSDKDEDDVMLYQPVLASTPKQEGDGQCVQLQHFPNSNSI